MRTLNEYLAWPWWPCVMRNEDGWQLTLPPLDDFAMYSDSREELLAEWRMALHAHLRAYLSVGKVIPFPSAGRGAACGENEFHFAFAAGQLVQTAGRTL